MKKNFDTVKTFRKIKEKISKELEGKTTEQILQFLKLNIEKFQLDK
jgi:hypothetical protein